MQPTIVSDCEELYRSVRPGEYVIVEERTIISASAFNDRERKPSVDRKWEGRKIEETRKSSSDGIVKIVADDVRKTSSVGIFDEKGKRTSEHAVDVVHRPIVNDPDQADNPAHCQIECHPAIEKDGSFKRLKEAMAALATRHGWVVAPEAPVSYHEATK